MADCIYLRLWLPLCLVSVESILFIPTLIVLSAGVHCSFRDRLLFLENFNFVCSGVVHINLDVAWAKFSHLNFWWIFEAN